MLAMKTVAMPEGPGRLAAVAAIAVAVGLGAGWTAGTFKVGKRAKPGGASEAVSQADLIKTDLWKTFGETGAIVMVGDSHTDYADWPAMFPGAAIVNRGVGGDTTRSVLARLDTVLSVRASTAVVTLGTNDVLRGYGLDTIEANYHAIIDRLRVHGARVVVTSTPFTQWEHTRAAVAALNADLRAYCDGRRCTFVDLNATIAAGGRLRPEMTVDGIHLSGAGYAQWAAALAPHLRD